MKKGFTLIELLIVVAIIAILAAIAVPNFLEAQTRSKVSRVKAELRTVQTAVEAYYIDYNKPPPQTTGQHTNTPWAPVEFQGQTGTGTLSYAITTPVAYISSFLFFDPFANQDRSIPLDERLYTYQAYQWKWPQQPSSGNGFTTVNDTTQETGNERLNGQQWREKYGNYMMFSIGPDRTFYNRRPSGSSPYPISLPYDPTNGTVSYGNVIRSQKFTEHK